MLLSLAALLTLGASAEEKKNGENKNKPVFTTIKENKITSIKDQNRSGTCWDYSTLSYFEAEILKKTGKTYDAWVVLDDNGEFVRYRIEFERRSS